MQLNVTINEEQADKVYSGTIMIGQSTVRYTLTYHHGMTPLDAKGHIIQGLHYGQGGYASLTIKNKEGQQIPIPDNISNLFIGQLGLAILPIHDYRNGDLKWLDLPEPVAEMIKKGIPFQVTARLPIIENAKHLYHTLEEIIKFDGMIGNQQYRKN